MTILRSPRMTTAGLAVLRQAAVPAFGFIPHLANKPFMALDAELDHDVDKEIQQALDVRARELPPARALLDEEHQLLKGELAAAGVDTGNGARMAGVHITQIIERFLRPELRKQDPVGLHAQAGLEELLRSHAGESLIILRVEQPDVIGMPIQDQLPGVLDGDQAFLSGDLPDEGLGPGGLSGAG